MLLSSSDLVVTHAFLVSTELSFLLNDALLLLFYIYPLLHAATTNITKCYCYKFKYDMSEIDI